MCVCLYGCVCTIIRVCTRRFVCVCVCLCVFVSVYFQVPSCLFSRHRKLKSTFVFKLVPIITGGSKGTWRIQMGIHIHKDVYIYLYLYGDSAAVSTPIHLVVESLGEAAAGERL